MKRSVALGSSTFHYVAKLGLVVAVISTTGCAGVSFIPLNEDGHRDWNRQEGLVYYRPVPYILAVALPTPTTAITKSTQSSPTHEKGARPIRGHPLHPNAAAPGAGKPDGAIKNGGAAGEDGSPGAAAPPKATDPSPQSDTEFSATNEKYSIKIVYLPDYSHPYAISISTGLFGTVSAKPQLQDGWMLTGLDSSADSKASETITAFGTLLSAAVGAASPAGPIKPHVVAPGVAAQAASGIIPGIAAPGLYKFCYQNLRERSATSGLIVGVQQIAVFSNTGALIPALAPKTDCAAPEAPAQPASK